MEFSLTISKVIHGVTNSIRPCLLFAGALLLTACASTRVTSVWEDSDYQQRPIQSVLVIGISEIMKNRKLFEDAMIFELEKFNIKALASHKVLEGQKLEKENIVVAATQNKLQAVLVTRLVGAKEEQVYIRRPDQFDASDRYYQQWDTYYSRMYDYARVGGDTETYKNYRLETSVFDVRDRKLVWLAATETFEPSSIKKDIQRLANTLVTRMKKSKMLR